MLIDGVDEEARGQRCRVVEVASCAGRVAAKRSASSVFALIGVPFSDSFDLFEEVRYFVLYLLGL